MVLCISLALILTGCDDWVEKEKYQSSQKETADVKQQLNESQESLRKVQEEVSRLQAHKYEIFHRGSRTWRLDTVNGDTCILLTTPEDWKRTDTQRESCK